MQINSTISRDDTVDNATKERQLLSQLRELRGDMALALNNHDNADDADDKGPGLPPRIAARPPLPPEMLPPDQRPPHFLPGMAPMGPLVQPPPGSPPRRSAPEDPVDNKLPIGSMYKANPGASWRLNLSKTRADLQKGATQEVGPKFLGANPNTPGNLGGVNLQLASGHSPQLPPDTHHEAASSPELSEGIKTRNLESIGPETSNSLPSRTLPATPHKVASATGFGKDEAKLGLADALAAVAESYLQTSLLEQDNIASMFTGYLLDTIELLSRKVEFLEAPDQPSDYEESDSSSVMGDLDQTEAPEPEPSMQVLHRILCFHSDHTHDGDIFEDKPCARKADAMLHGKRPIADLDRYIAQHPGLSFIVFTEHSCTARGGWTKQSSQQSEKIRVISQTLQKALLKCARFRLLFGPDDANEMEAPYDFIYHHRESLAALAKGSDYGKALSPLLEFVEKNYAQHYDECERLISGGRITASHLGKLFQPNQMVVCRKLGRPLDAFVLIDYPRQIFSGGGLHLSGWEWIYDGAKLKRQHRVEGMPLISDEETEITDLEIHPFESARPEDKRFLAERGKKFWEMRGKAFVAYTGWNFERSFEYLQHRFVVDPVTYRLIHDKQTVRPVGFGRPTMFPITHDPWPHISRDDALPPAVAPLLPASVLGFDISQKKWVKLCVENCHAVSWNTKAFDRLVLDPKTKEMIRALVEVQMKATKMEDVITGKGNGLIVLLHGSPGTGKTLTAESVAEIAKKPLYRVTCGDIGVDPTKVEKYLETVLYLGKVWDCVLLLDEADVFLEERTMADLQRNSLVSIFLRVLEYYEGILILTSNRVGSFDEAFKSRIQVAIHYDQLTKKSRKAIWRNFFDMMEESDDEDVNMAELERRLDELAAEEMNGRQIRNALLTARQLAKHRQERLDWEHLSQVIKTSVTFNKYIKTLRGHSDDQWAREERLR
ncbi:hypothetical protein RB595_007270 [Gaeumannomyces hyphopodioides]